MNTTEDGTWLNDPLNFRFLRVSIELKQHERKCENARPREHRKNVENGKYREKKERKETV